MERDSLAEEAVLRRISAQPSNADYVHHANVIFSTEWEPEYTQKQVYLSLPLSLSLSPSLPLSSLPLSLLCIYVFDQIV